MEIVDLHVHSTRSDGSFTPTELVHYAVEKGLKAFALTDHDTTEGLAEAMTAAKDLPIEVIPGIEFSTEYEGKDIHIVGLYINYEGNEFKKYIKEFQESRDLRNRKMCAKLTEHGVPVTYEEISERYSGSVLTRAHYAKYLLEKGYVKSMPEAFDRYIGDHAPCFLPREKVTPVQAVQLILRAGGIPVLAHPILYHMSDARLEKLVATLKNAGLVAIEAIYSTYTNSEERQIRQLADKYNLLISGGSDFHGNTKPGLDLAIGYGKLCIPYEILQHMKNYLAKNKRIMFCDMDGTLLNDQKEVMPETLEALKVYFSHGGKLVLTSGRPLNSILEVAKKFGLDLPGTYIIAFNGALIYDCDAKKAIHEMTVPTSLHEKYMEIARKHDVYCHSYMTDENGQEVIVTEKDGEELTYYRRAIHLPYQVTDNLAKALPAPPYKFIAICLEDNHDRLDAFRAELAYAFGDEMLTLYSNAFYLECCMKEATKGNAIHFLCDYLNIPLEESAACGDANNDISMLKTAGFGVAMANAKDEVKQSADYVTVNTNNENGIKEVLEKFMV